MSNSIQNRQQAELLDSLDGIRRANLGTTIDVPHMVVCADRSTNIDDLLEAITQLQFPDLRSSLQCAVELVMRYAPNPWIHAVIQPAPHRSVSENMHFMQFRYTSFTTSIRETSALFKMAKDNLNGLETVSGYWHDVLRIEINGPFQLPLTLTVLPSLHQEATDECNLEDTTATLELVRSHILRPRTIVLAVVNAMWDSELQLVRDLINSPFAIQKRTLGVITKPEGALEKEDVQRMVGLMSNNDLQLGNGWHVVKNLDHKTKDRSLENRNLQEASFFKSGRWSGLPSSDTGIDSLRQKLHRCLFESIDREMPSLLEDMTQQLRNSCKKSDSA